MPVGIDSAGKAVPAEIDSAGKAVPAAIDSAGKAVPVRIDRIRRMAIGETAMALVQPKRDFGSSSSLHQSLSS